jgi:hypothetical protein
VPLARANRSPHPTSTARSTFYFLTLNLNRGSEPNFQCVGMPIFDLAGAVHTYVELVGLPSGSQWYVAVCCSERSRSSFAPCRQINVYIV